MGGSGVGLFMSYKVNITGGTTGDAVTVRSTDTVVVGNYITEYRHCVTPVSPVSVSLLSV